MSLEIQRGSARAVGIVADRRLYLSADRSQVLEEGDASAAWLFVTPGMEIPASEVARLGLVAVDGRVSWGPDPEPEPAPDPYSVPAAKEADGPDLPEDMPGRDALADAGLGTLEDVAAAENLTSVSGIGRATASRIREYLEGLAE